MDKRRVRLNINGVVCGLITGESEEYMQTLADEVGDLMKQIMAASPFITREAAALTTALSICDDCHKNTDLARRLAKHAEKLEAETKLWQEEKEKLLKSAADTQKDAQLAEKAAQLAETASRLESENTRLEESLSRFQGIEEQARKLKDENSVLRQAVKAGEAASQEAATLQKEVERLQSALRQKEDALQSALQEKEEALQSAQEQPAQTTAPPKEPSSARPAVKRRRGNPLRQQPELEQEGMVSFFQTEHE